MDDRSIKAPLDPDKLLSLLIQAINKREPLLWFQCMASPVRNEIAKMNPAELQDYFNKQWSKFPFQITEHDVEHYTSTEVEIAGCMKVTMVTERGRWWVLSLEKGKIDLAISLKDIFLTRDENGRLLIAVDIHNKGNIRVSHVDARYFMGNPEEGGTLIGQGGLAIEPDSSAIEAIHWDVDDGEYEVFVIVDPENQIAETNEDNNQASRIVRVDSKK